MRLDFSAEAEGDLRSIGAYIAADNPRRAVSFLRELRTVCERTARTPRGSPLLTDLEARGIRRRPFGNYVIFYRAGENAVVIVRILHAARNYSAILDPDG
jgi:plasmid stabilization system protein ParE